MKYYVLILLGLNIISVVLLILSLIFGGFFTFFPLLFIFPLSLIFKRRFEAPDDSQSGTNSENISLEKRIETNKSVHKKCAKCNTELFEENLRFCPICGMKL